MKQQRERDAEGGDQAHRVVGDRIGRDRAGEQANQESLQALRKTADEANSGLAASWAAVCLNLYGQDTTDWQKRVEKRFRETGFLGETKTLALALLALNGKSNPFRI